MKKRNHTLKLSTTNQFSILEETPGSETVNNGTPGGTILIGVEGRASPLTAKA